MSHRLRTTALLSVLALLAGLLAGLSDVASAAGAPLIQGDTTVGPGADYATDTFSDPWDYRNDLDVLLDVNGPTHGLANQRLEDGKLVFDLGSGGGSFWPLYMNVPGSLSDVRDGPSFPLNADRYTHMTIRMYSGQAFPGAMLRFFTCESYDHSCQGAHVFGIESGWRTYTFRVESNNPFGLDKPWAGDIVGIRMDTGGQPDGKSSHVEIDWIRAHDDHAATTVTWANPGNERLYWDRDTDPSNNTDANRGWGVVDGDAKPGTVNSAFLHGAYEQGTYHFYTGTSPTTATSTYSEAFTIDAAPLISFDDPDETGGEDHATAHLGNPWDFSDPADAAQIVNATDISWSGGQLHATNTSNDPYVRLSQAGTIDPSRYHRLTVKMTYDGQFNLADEPGGGTHGRLIWWRQDTGNAFHNSREILTFATRDTYTFDLSQLNVSEPGNEQWTGSPITYLRWDPNEDRGAARWHLDDIKLAADDEATGGSFDVRWRDHNGNEGATVALFDDRNRHGYNGRKIADGISQTEGQNTHRLNVRDMLPGRRWLYAEADNGTSVGRQYARGPLRVDPRLAGTNRDLTAIALSRNAFPKGAKAAIVAYNGDFPDALAAAPLAAASAGPVLLNPQDHLSADVEAELERLKVDTVYLMGGTAVQSRQVERSIGQLGVTVQRVAGTGRWETAAQAARTARELWQQQGVEQAGDHVLVALGTGFADALAAGPLAAAARRPLVLVAGDAVPAATNAVLEEFGTTEVTLIGGTAAIPEHVARQVGDGATRRHRIGGTSRFGTAALVADAAAAAGADPAVVLVAPGGGFPDALAAGPSVAARGGVLLLTAGDQAPSDTRDHLTETASGLKWLRVAGGRAVVSDGAVGQLLDAAKLPH